MSNEDFFPARVFSRKQALAHPAQGHVSGIGPAAASEFDSCFTWPLTFGEEPVNA